jgi:hypothetical protein
MSLIPLLPIQQSVETNCIFQTLQSADKNAKM